MDAETCMLSQICGDVGVNICMNCSERFAASLRRVSYTPVLDARECDIQQDALSVVMPKNGLRPRTLAVDARGNTMVVQDDTHVPMPVRGSSPSFDLHKIFGDNAVVHAVFFRSKNDMQDLCRSVIKMSIFDISECRSEDFRNLSILQRYSRLEHIFQWAWFNLQHGAVMDLCKKLQFSSSAKLQELGQKLMHAQEVVEGSGERTVQWSPEFLNAFANYSLVGLGDYRTLLRDIPEMETVRFPIPTHIQLSHAPIPAKDCFSLRDRVDLKLPGNPVFGGVLQLPETITDSETASLWTEGGTCSETQ
tara:strand:- start:13049 stop:13966 length:918 start_codon:yes stop_codon:yes gene_type:complete